MGESAAETVDEIEVIRDRLDDEVREFEERLPAPVVMSKRLVGVAVGGGFAASAFWFAFRRMQTSRKVNKAKGSAEGVQIIQLMPDNMGRRVSAALDDGTWQGWAAVVGGVWLLFRLAELRQLRRMNGTLLDRMDGAGVGRMNGSRLRH